MNPRPSISTARTVSLGRLGDPVVVRVPSNFCGGDDSLDLVPSVCSLWEKPGPVELTRLAGLDLERCGLLIRSELGDPLPISPPSIDAFLSAQIFCVGTNVSFANREELLHAGLVVLEYLSLVDLPRAGFCVSVSPTEVTATVRAHQWTN